MRPLLLTALLVSCLNLAAEPRLAVTPLAASFTFDLADATGEGSWSLQHSADGETWEDLIFFPETRGGTLIPTVQVARAGLPDPAASTALFRAVQLPGEATFQRRFLTERMKWRLSGSDDYNYELQQSISFIFWRGNIEVTNDEVTSFTTLEFYSPFPDPPARPTIDELFARIADAIAQDAFQIDVTWHPTLGYPADCYIDYDVGIADEERGWAINSFTPAP